VRTARDRAESTPANIDFAHRRDRAPKGTLEVAMLCSLAWSFAACPAPTRPHAGEGEGAAGEGEGEGVAGEGEGTSSPFFVAVGFGGRRMSSADGTAWSNDASDAQNGGDDDNLLRGVCTGVANGKRLAVAVGGSIKGRILTSTDGATWTTALSDDLGWLGGCAFNADGSIIVAAGSGRAIRSVDGGATWTDPQVEFFGGNGWQLRDVAFLGGVFGAVGDAGTSTSSDGVTWTAPSGPTKLAHVAAGNGAWVAVGNDQRAHSSDAINWTVDAVSGVQSVTFDGSRFVVVGNFLAQFSSDGASFDEHSIAPAPNLIAFGANAYVSSSFPNARQISTDALTWSDVASDQGNPLSAIAFAR
jgi:hypothetical protein